MRYKRRKPMLRRFLFLAILLAGVPVLSQVPAPPAPPIASAPVDHSQEAYVVEKLRTSYRFENDGNGRREFYVRVKIQSDSGGGQLGEIVMGSNSADERVEIPVVCVL